MIILTEMVTDYYGPQPPAMQSAPDNLNADDSESTFDFLSDRTPGTVDMSSVDRNIRKTEPDDSNAPPRRKSSTAGKPFPVIRKPVSVKESGALRPPQPGAPVEPPPPLTDGIRANDVPKARAGRAELDITDLNEFDFDDDDWPDSDQWVDKSLRERYSNPGTVRITRKASGTRRVLYAAAILLIGGGIVSALYTVPSVQSWAQSTLAVLSSQATSALDSIKDRLDAGVEQASGPDEPGNSAIVQPDPTSLNARFRNQLANLETLIAQGELDQADQVLQTMDRSVFGYGAPEFSQISERITAIRQGGDGASQAATDSEGQALAQADLLAEQQAEQARAAEAQRQAQQEQAAAEAQRLAQQEQAAAEAQRLAQQEQAAAEAAEAQRLAQQEQAAAEAQRLAQQEQAAAEAQRLAQQEQAAAEAQRQAQRNKRRQKLNVRRNWNRQKPTVSLNSNKPRQNRHRRTRCSRQPSARWNRNVLPPNHGVWLNSAPPRRSSRSGLTDWLRSRRDKSNSNWQDNSVHLPNSKRQSLDRSQQPFGTLPHSRENQLASDVCWKPGSAKSRSTGLETLRI